MGKNFTLYEIIFLYAFNQLEISKQGSSLLAEFSRPEECVGVGAKRGGGIRGFTDE
jgi:hypothetical protein